MSDVHYFAELTWKQAEALLAGDRTPVLLLPVDAVEPHGPHAPLDTDRILSLGTCARATRALADDGDVRPLVLPPISYGVTRYGAAFPGAIGIEEDTMLALVLDVCGSLIDQGFRHLVIVNNHLEPGHVATLRQAVETIRSERGIAVGHLDLTRQARAKRLGDEFSSGSCHAGRYETSLVLADRPELVDLSVMTALPPLTVNMPEAMASGKADFPAMGMDEAYCGAPAEATAMEGEATFATLTDMLVEVIRDVLRD